MLVVVAAVAPAQVDPNRVIATINGEPIKGSEYYHRMEFLPGVGRFLGNRFAQLPPGFMTLDALITEKLVLQLAKSKGVYPSDPEVTAELMHRIEENPRYEQDAIEGGLSKEDLLGQIRVELAQFKIVSFGINITDQEVEDFFKKNPSRYTIPKRMKLRVIAVMADGKPKVDAALTAGRSFPETAKLYSLDLSKNSGGDLGLLPLYTFPDETKTILSSLKIGHYTDWIKQGDTAWLRYFYEDAKPEEKLPLTPALRRSIRQELMVVKGGIKNNLKDEMKTLRRAAKIEITEKDFADAYKKFVDQYIGPAGG
jgi:parvulin-like peptidyl-prolyl isomerase